MEGSWIGCQPGLQWQVQGQPEHGKTLKNSKKKKKKGNNDISFSLIH